MKTRFEWFRDSASVGAAVDAFGDMESRGWKAAEGTALHSSNAQGRFYRALLERYCSNGEASALQYFYNDALVASDLCLHRDGVLILLKTTHDEGQKTTSPSYLLRQESMQKVFDQGGFRRVEFYGRVMEWHTRWTNEFRRLYHINQFRFRLAARLYAMRNRDSGRAGLTRPRRRRSFASYCSVSVNRLVLVAPTPSSWSLRTHRSRSPPFAPPPP